LERSDNPGIGPLMYIPTLKGFAARGTLSGLTAVFIHLIPELSLRSNSGLKLANAFGVFVQRFQTNALRNYYSARSACEGSILVARQAGR
jgi:hypothetical protein